MVGSCQDNFSSLIKGSHVKCKAHCGTLISPPGPSKLMQFAWGTLLLRWPVSQTHDLLSDWKLSSTPEDEQIFLNISEYVRIYSYLDKYPLVPFLSVSAFKALLTYYQNADCKNKLKVCPLPCMKTETFPRWAEIKEVLTGLTCAGF